jgi:choline-sulfatase
MNMLDDENVAIPGRGRSLRPQNLLFIFSDEHNRDITGCYGNTLVKTPHMDALAARGTRFDAAYTNCPICVPARASLAAGRYVHEIGCWDNAHPYDGSAPGWGHRLIETGHDVTAIGKLHYRNATDPTGFSQQVNTLNVVDGLGDLLGMIRRELPERGNARKLAEDAGRGESTYTQYDRDIATASKAWLENRAANPTDKPWMLFVGFVLPHFPLVAPNEFFDLYDPAKMPMPRLTGAGETPDHPVLMAQRACMNYADYFDDERTRIALAAYYGMVSFLDHNIGILLKALEDSGLAGDTRVIYTSDHGDNLGNRGYWGKSVMYEDSAAVPMIMAGDDIPQGHVVKTPVSLVDLHPTFLAALGESDAADEPPRPGKSLFDLARNEQPDRVAFSEYHAAGANTGVYMIRKGQWKYIHYVGHRPQLFDLAADPHEADDLGASPEHAAKLAELEGELQKILDPDAVNDRAFADQERRIAQHGGEEALKKRGDFGYTPAPGQTPVFG